MNNFKSNWFLVYTKQREELRANQQLHNQGFITFLPIICKSKDYENLDSNSEIMFPRYIFVKLNTKIDTWHKINSTRGVSHIVMFGNSMAKIDTKIIHYMISKCDDQGIFYQRHISLEYEKGDEIIIEKGLLKNNKAIFLSKNSNERVKILLTLANKKKVITDVSVTDIPEKTQLDSISIKKN